ncbi:ATP-dependent Clp protease ATP-binding subunit ClpB [Planctomycetales bacterium 10988]|nr:ATP-dependent Clp protease ATP-binding subunit ClpB [Planctomycetales bacterium 10988]
MVTVNLKSLFSKLNKPCHQALQGAAGLCVQRTNYEVEFEHVMAKLLDVTSNDVDLIIRHYGINISKLLADTEKTLDGFKRGSSRKPAFSQKLLQVTQEAWLLASVDYGTARIRSGHLLLAWLASPACRQNVQEFSEEWKKINPDTLKAEFTQVTESSNEFDEAIGVGGTTAPAGPSGEPGRVRPGSKTPSLDQFTNDLTAQAKEGKIDPVLGRDMEIRQLIDVLTRRRQNNPILTGEAGVGKTAVVEGFALRISQGDVPPPLKNVRLLALDLGLLQAGAGMKGEFEDRLKNVIEEVKSSSQPIIMFIDEAHTMIGAGGAAGQNDAANLLKPALARGELRTIAATTWAEYKKFFEKDPALTRRFQVVKVEEPSEVNAVNMMRGLMGTLEKHHSVRITDVGVVDSVRLSNRYIAGRQLPDKSVSLLDTACARVRLSQTATPPAIEDAQREIESLQTNLKILERELQAGYTTQDKLDVVQEEIEAAKQRKADLQARHGEEMTLVERINEIHRILRGDPAPEVDGKKPEPTEPLTEEELDELRAELKTKEAELAELQGETPLVQVCVDGQSMAEVVGDWTGIPVGRMLADEIQTVLKLQDKMKERVVGQDHALEAIADRIRTSRAGMGDPRRPIGVFMLAGTSGTGKTETALTLAELLYGGEQNLTVINMSEFKEEHKVSLLLGSPPGYVGYGEGGVLTEAVRRKPYSVVLLDEVEKAHPGVQEIFYQVFDKGMLKDGEGRDIDFKNTVIILTTNAGTDTIMKVCADPETMPDAEGLGEALRPELLQTYKPAFLGRTTVVPYFPLGDEVIKKIVGLNLAKIRRRVQDNHQAEFSYSPELVETIAARCTEVETGARNIDYIITQNLLPQLSSEILSRMAEGETIDKVHVTVDEEGAFKYELE